MCTKHDMNRVGSCSPIEILAVPMNSALTKAREKKALRACDPCWCTNAQFSVCAISVIRYISDEIKRSDIKTDAEPTKSLR